MWNSNKKERGGRKREGGRGGGRDGEREGEWKEGREGGRLIFALS